MLGNKGALTVSFDYMGTRVAFTTAHFAAHQRRVKPRNDTFQEICSETVLPSLRAPELGDFTVAHDVCFFCGDLNYRLELPRSAVLRLVEAGSDADFRALNARDADAQAAPKNRYAQLYLETAGRPGDLRVSTVVSGDPVIVGSVFVHERM